MELVFGGKYYTFTIAISRKTQGTLYLSLLENVTYSWLCFIVWNYKPWISVHFLSKHCIQLNNDIILNDFISHYNLCSVLLLAQCYFVMFSCILCTFVICISIKKCLLLWFSSCMYISTLWTINHLTVFASFRGHNPYTLEYFKFRNYCAFVIEIVDQWTQRQVLLFWFQEMLHRKMTRFKILSFENFMTIVVV